MSVSKNFKSYRILLLEDDPNSAEIVTRTLEKYNILIDHVVNARLAINKLKIPYDLIISDVMMPVMDGCEAAQEIRALPRKDAKTIPIIAMTANAFTDDKIRTREAGMNEHLSKPLAPDLVVKTITKFLGRSN